MKAQRAQAERAPRSFWFDPRFAVGIGLVVVAVLGVVFIVSTADTTVQVYSARTTLSPGDRLNSGDLESRSVRLGAVEGKYILAGELPSAGFVLTRAVAAGELVPLSALGNAAGVDVASIVIAVKGTLSQSVVAGSLVDVWSSRQADNRSYGPPAVLVSAVAVVRVVEQQGIMAGRDGQSVEVLVPRISVAAVLEAIANSDAISLVPTGIPAKR